MINLGWNRNHYQGYILASNLRHKRSLPTLSTYIAVETRLMLLKVINFKIIMKIRVYLNE